MGKLWLQRRGGRVPDGDVTSDADRKKMSRLIRNRMRVTTPCFKAKAPPKRPKKGRNTGFIRRNARATKPVVAVAVAVKPIRPIVAVVPMHSVMDSASLGRHSQSVSVSMNSPPRNDFNAGNASMEPMMGTPPSDRALCAYSATPSRNHRNDYEAKEPETPQIPRFAMAPPQTPQIAQNFTSNSFRTPKFGTPKCSSVMETPSLMPMLSTLHESNEALLTTPMPSKTNATSQSAHPQIPETPMMRLFAMPDSDDDDEEINKNINGESMDNESIPHLKSQQMSGGFLNSLSWAQ